MYTKWINGPIADFIVVHLCPLLDSVSGQQCKKTSYFTCCYAGDGECAEMVQGPC